MLKDFISRNVVTVEPDTRVSKVAEVMAKEDVGCVVIVENDKPRGMITDRDIVLRCVARHVDVDDCTVENVMTESLETILETEGVFECIKKMRDAGVRRMPVVNDQGDIVGLLSFGDLLSVLSREFYHLTARTTPEFEEGMGFEEKFDDKKVA